MRVESLLCLLAMLLCPVISSAAEVARQDGDFWVPVAELVQGTHVEARFQLDLDGLRKHLSVLPAADADAEGSLPLSLPLPDGRRVPFEVSRSLVMDPALAAKFPELATFQGVAVDGSGLRVRFEVSDAGLGAMLFGGGVRLVEHDPDSGDYVARERRADLPRPPFSCGVRADHTMAVPKSFAAHLAPIAKATGPNLRTYRTAIAATGEFTATYGGRVVDGMRGIVSTVNRLNQIFQTDLGIRLVLVAGNDRLVYTNPATDPYDNDDQGALLGQNQENIGRVIGSSNYDLGHVFATSGGGVAAVGSVCVPDGKAFGVSGGSAPGLDFFWVDYVAHEIGHQLNALHTFNGASCGVENRTAEEAYEPGSGSTIMAYAGVCGDEDVQGNADPFFHVSSLQVIHAFTQTGTGSTCGVVTPTGNQTPVLTATPNRTIPARTPFALTATASDPDAADRLTYVWEQFDLGAATNAATVNTDLGSGPLFRSFDASASPTRLFPQLADILAGRQTTGEVLPTTNRTLTFRVTTRDNRGGVQWTGSTVPAVAQTTLTVVNTGAAFALMGPNAPTTWAAGSTQTAAWNVAGTAAAPISCANVALSWSSDGGQSFGTVLSASTANDGSHNIVVPAQATTAGRLRVACTNNIFFDINNAPITVTGGNQPPVVALAGGSASYTSNGPAALVSGAATVSDADSANFDGGNLTATLTNNAGFDDRLAIRNQGTGAGQIGVAGTTISFGGAAIGTLSGGVGAAPLVVALNASATPAATQALLRNLTFGSTGDVSGTLPRTLAVSVADGDGGVSIRATREIAISLNFDPVLAFMDDGDVDNLLPSNRAQNWTVAFTKDIDLASVSAADFDNAGSAPITIGAITEPSAGVLRVPVTPTGAGTIILRLPAAASVRDATGLAVSVPAQDNDSVAVDATLPTLVSIDDGDADNLVAVGAALTYRLVFSEDVALASFSSADFDNAGTALVTIGTITEPTAGTIRVAVTVDGEGTLRLRLPASAVVTDVAGNGLMVPRQDEDILEVRTGLLFANSFEP